MAYIEEIRSLVYLWDGRNGNDRIVGPGSYYAVVTIWYTDKPGEVKKQIVGVRK